MRIRIALGLAAIAALALAAVAFAAPSQYKVTGGGQVFASSAIGEDGKPTVKGPGDTITFNAFINDADGDGVDSDATGKVNIIDREQDGSGQALSGKGLHYTGTVDCVFIDPTAHYAELYGTARKNSGATTPFIVRIQDNGQGAAAENDLVEFNYTDEPPTCDDEPEDSEFGFGLARGNAKIHKESTSQSSAAKSKSTSTSTSSLTSALSLR